MKILYVGTVLGSYLKLKAVLAAGGNVIGVITLHPKYSYRHSDYFDFTSVCQELDLPLYQINNINDKEVMEIVNTLRPDVIFVFGWSQILTKELLAIPPNGVVGFHPSLLPANRGRHPVIWALVKGWQETGISFFFMAETIDSGRIIAQKRIKIDLEDDAKSLIYKINMASSELIIDFLPKLICNKIKSIAQDSSKATYLRKRNREDGYIDWSRRSIDTYNLIRGLTDPYPGASAFFKGKEVKIWKSVFHFEKISTKAGMFKILSNGDILVQTGDISLKLLKCEIEGMRFAEFLISNNKKDNLEFDTHENDRVRGSSR